MIPISLNWLDWLQLFQYHFMLSFLSFGGAIAAFPEIHRFLVEQNQWLTETQFSASVAIGQAAPGPNVLFIALLAWNVGMNSGNMGAGIFGAFIAMAGMLIPSTTMTYLIFGWLQRNRELRGVRAFKQGLAPIVIALLIATGWIMARTNSVDGSHLWLVTLITTLIMWRTQIHILWAIGIGALLGWFEFI